MKYQNASAQQQKNFARFHARIVQTLARSERNADSYWQTIEQGHGPEAVAAIRREMTTESAFRSRKDAA